CARDNPTYGGSWKRYFDLW
nr:immunoglobulin heavy chain junction region [Macaca mulatta]MOW86553.1 immunoglobulin heavy chain junction region [Macaca mulatta]MOW86586.1 immunoglobulin heavy chain junction region [Macaca mulatta]MOW86610.1 immunoglobulin heavy chain junction region [Macaca mulatta]MOW86640.1 immunoglobulin heavy chain junction region [Macaca mulatta]